MKWTEKQIQIALSYFFFDWRRQIIIPNVSYGFFAGHRGECDLLVISKARYLTEIEIKVDAQDLANEKKKFKHDGRTEDNPFGPLIKRYYIAAPAEVWEKADGVELPYGVGKLSVKMVTFADSDRVKTPRVELVTPSVCNKAARPLTEKEMVELLRLVYFRLWSSADMKEVKGE